MLSINFVPTRRDSHRSRDSSFRRSYFASSKTRYPEREVEASKNPRAALLRPRLKDFCHSSASTRADQILTTVMTRLSLSPPSSLDRSVSLILVARRKNSWRTHVHEGSGERWLLLRDSRLRYRSIVRRRRRGEDSAFLRPDESRIRRAITATASNVQRGRGNSRDV